jgi:hypothetical protein
MEMHGQNELILALVAAGKEWLALTLVAGLPEVWVLALVLHLGRPYMLRTLRKCTLRFGADVWWLSYVLLRDGAMIAAFASSVVFLMPDLVTKLDLPLTGSLSGLLLFWALLIKLIGDADDNPQHFRAVTVLMVAAAALFLVPLVLGPKAAGPLEGSALAEFLTTRRNQIWAIALLLLAVGGYLVTGAYIFGAVLARSRPKKVSVPRPRPAAVAERQTA